MNLSDRTLYQLASQFILGKKKSTISSSNLSKENLVTLIERCIDTTQITPEDEFNSLPDNSLLAERF